MNDYFIECTVGGTTIVKVTAESRDKALELSALMVADDWNNAGSLRPHDVRQEVKSYQYTHDEWIEQVDDLYRRVDELYRRVDESERSPA